MDKQEYIQQLKYNKIKVTQIPNELLVDHIFYQDVCKIMEEKVVEYCKNKVFASKGSYDLSKEIKLMIDKKMQQFKVIMAGKRSSFTIKEVQNAKLSNTETELEAHSTIVDSRIDAETKEEINRIYAQWVENYNKTKNDATYNDKRK